MRHKMSAADDEREDPVNFLPPSPSGRARVSGNSALQATQEYTEEFAGDVHQ